MAIRQLTYAAKRHFGAGRCASVLNELFGKNNPRETEDTEKASFGSDLATRSRLVFNVVRFEYQEESDVS